MSHRPVIPRLFRGNATTFTTQGLGALTDAASVTITEELNGGMELVMVYPVNGLHFDDITTRSLILAKPNPVRDPYPFRVYSITKPLNGRCTIRAHGWHYDLSGVPVAPFTKASPAGVMTQFNTGASVSHVFTFATSLSNAGTFKCAVPSSIFSLMGGTEGSVLDVFGGEWQYGYQNDPKKIALLSYIGQNRGVVIRYGKNMTSLEQEENIASMYTGVYPYWASADGGVLVTLPEEILNASGSYSFTRIMPLDLTASFEEQPSVSDLRSAANAYMTANEIGTPRVSLNVNMALLGQTDQYATEAMLEDVSLGDTVTVTFDELGVSATARVVATDYNPITGRFNSVRIGSVKANLSDTIAAQEKKVTTLRNNVTTPVAAAISRATDRIVGNLGGYIVLRYNGNGEPYELLIMDDPDINVASKVWRWNAGGLGYSNTGYNGTYGTAITADGEIVADFITAGLMSANRITMEAQSGDQLTDYFRVGMEGGKAVVELGADENNIVLRLLNDRISFCDTQGNELAYFSDNSFEIVSLQSFVLQDLKIAVLANGAYGFMKNS